VVEAFTFVTLYIYQHALELRKVYIDYV